MDLWTGMQNLGFALIGALIALIVPLLRPEPRPVAGVPALLGVEGGIVLLFRGERLLDATPRGHEVLASARGRTDLARLITACRADFPQIAARMAALQAGRMVMSDASGRHLLLAERMAQVLRVTLVPVDAAATDPPLAGARDAALQAVDAAVTPMWHETRDGVVTWGNAAYARLAREVAGSGLGRLFPPPTGAGQRHRLDLAGRSQWFEIVITDLAEGRLGQALPIDPLVKAEATLREFMRTLGETFAHLSTGLAVFDRDRHLKVFNPALGELTGLTPEFLMRRPSLLAVLDAMRDRNMIPEPKDWPAWRRQMAAMERAALAGDYEETWALPGGQTYRVTGRPHPDGAMALMIEDISTEISRSRRYRADMELGQAVIDTMAEGIAVFSTSGQLVMSNLAYARLWGHDPGESLTGGNIKLISAHWRAASAPTTIWAEVEEFVATLGERRAFHGEVRLRDGRLMLCRLAPLAGGATLASFHLLPVVDEALHVAAPKGDARRKRA
ncbi:MAG: hypothetical protein RIT14_1678 [Pseudomonadota bacterium]